MPRISARLRIATAVCAALLAPLLNPAPAGASNALTMLGADVSSLQRSLDLGATYYDQYGHAGDALDILKSKGVNYVRLRIWNNPASGYNNLAEVLRQARTARAKGFSLMLDFHYSDTWADPGKQYKPAAWASDDIWALQKDVYDFTYSVCTALKNQHTTPDSVQLGNEINIGMLFDDGKIVRLDPTTNTYYNDFTNLSMLLKSGYNATKACSSGIQVVIHTADADSDAHAEWFYDGIRDKGVNWDITGLSYYCKWHGTLANLYNVLSDMRTRYRKPVAVVETGYPFTVDDADSEPNLVPQPCSDYPATWQGQADEFRAVQNTARNAGAIGVFYWEPTWYAIAGNGWDPADIYHTGDQWDNMALFNWTGQVNPNVSWTP